MLYFLRPTVPSDLSIRIFAFLKGRRPCLVVAGPTAVELPDSQPWCLLDRAGRPEKHHNQLHSQLRRMGIQDHNPDVGPASETNPSPK